MRKPRDGVSDSAVWRPPLNLQLLILFQSTFDVQETNQSMNNVIVMLPKTDEINTYEFTLAWQCAGRYAMNTTLPSFTKPAPKSSTPDFMKRVAEAQGA